MNALRRLLFPLLLLALGACSSSENATTAVTGHVTWKGGNIPDGDILLYPEGMDGNPDPGKIKDGVYSLQAKPGKKIVYIFYSREKPGDPGVMNQREREQVIPKEFNHESTLTIEVK